MTEFEIKHAINHLSKLSDEQLMTELVKHMTVQKQKDGGANMQQTIERIKPLLNAEQRQRLEEILKRAGQNG